MEEAKKRLRASFDASLLRSAAEMGVLTWDADRRVLVLDELRLAKRMKLARQLTAESRRLIVDGIRRAVARDQVTATHLWLEFVPPFGGGR